MVRSKTQSRKAPVASTTQVVPASATSLVERKTGSDRPNKAVVMLKSQYFTAKKPIKKPVKKAASKPAEIQPPKHLRLSRFFPRPKGPTVPAEDLDAEYIQDAIRVAHATFEDKAERDKNIKLIQTELGFAVLFIETFYCSLELRLPKVRPILIQGVCVCIT